jgi:hypothetical protein
VILSQVVKVGELGIGIQTMNPKPNLQFNILTTFFGKLFHYGLGVNRLLNQSLEP